MARTISFLSLCQERCRPFPCPGCLAAAVLHAGFCSGLVRARRRKASPSRRSSGGGRSAHQAAADAHTAAAAPHRSLAGPQAAGNLAGGLRSRSCPGSNQIPTHRIERLQHVALPGAQPVRGLAAGTGHAAAAGAAGGAGAPQERRQLVWREQRSQGPAGLATLLQEGKLRRQRGCGGRGSWSGPTPPGSRQALLCVRLRDGLSGNRAGPRGMVGRCRRALLRVRSARKSETSYAEAIAAGMRGLA